MICIFYYLLREALWATPKGKGYYLREGDSFYKVLTEGSGEPLNRALS